MANEFVARNGLIAQDTSRISGSLLVTAGNIGVGTATPANRLHVIQDSSTAGISVSGVGTNPQLRATDGTRIAKLQALIDRGIVGTESNNDFSIFTNNSEIVRITTTGNVGIGSTAPTSKLQVIIPESTSGVTGVTIVGNTNSKVLALGASSTYAFVQSHGSVPLYINELGNNVIINPAAGNVGIGTTSPTVKLDVSGSVNVRSVAPTITFDRNGSYTWRLVNGDGGTYPLSTFNIGNNANTAIATFLDGGNVGIGITTPVSRLHVQQSITTVTTASLDNNTAVGLTVSYPDTTLSGGEGIAIALGMNGRGRSFIANIHTSTSKDASDIAFYNESGAIISEKVRINSLGNVGIGTSTPGAKLDVILPANILSHIFRSTAAENLLSIQTFPTTNRMQLLVGDYNGTATPNIAAISDSDTGIQWTGANVLKFVNGGSENVTINAVGNVGIGTTAPSAYLDIKGASDTAGVISLQLRSGNTSTNFNSNQVTLAYANTALYRHAIKTRHNSAGSSGNAIDFYTWLSSGASTDIGGQHVMSLDGANVGIGTTTPGAKLDVVGNVRAQSFTGSFSGSAVAPGTNAQIIFNSSGSLAASSNFVFTGTNVGIGATSPAYLLEVSGSVGITGGNSLTFGSTGTKTATIRHDASGLVISANIQNQYLSLGSSPAGSQNFPNGIFHYGGAHVFYSSTTEVARIDTSGNVGIGTTAPGEKLQVQGNIRFGTGGQASWGNGLLAVTNSWDGGASSYATIGSYGGSTGALIMLINPHTPFRTDNASGGYTGRAGLRMSANAGASVYWDAGLAGDFYHIFRQGTGEFLRINNVGNVGIGTTTPSYKLHISGGSQYIEGGFGANTATAYTAANRLIFNNDYSDSARGPNKITLYDSSWLGGFGVHSDSLAYYAGGNHRWYQATNATNAAHLMTLSTGGNLGIGTTNPNALLTLDSTEPRLRLNRAGTQHMIINHDGTTGTIRNESNTLLQIGTNGTAVLNITGSNVGIGTINPTSRLQVSGSSNTVNVKGSGSALFSVDGTVGRLFQVDDSLSGSLFSVNTAAGLPVIEAFSDNTVRIGQFGQRALFVSQSRVGVGLENPTANLHVSGTTGGVFEVDGVNAINALYVSSSGNIGIGTTTTVASANYRSLSISGPSGAEIYLYAGSTLYGYMYGNASGMVLAPQSSTPLIMSPGGSEKVRVTTAGSVGIGTSSPSRLLHVLSSDWDNTAGAGVIFENSNTVGSGITLKPNASVVTNGSSGWSMYAGGPGSAIGDGNLGFWAHGTNQSRLTIQRGGNIGIGSNTPGATLDVNGNVRAQSFTGSFSGSAAAPGLNTNVVYNNSGVLAGSNSFVFNGTNVGIGSTSPAARLDVAGTGRFSGDVTIVSSSLVTYSNSYGNNGLIRMFGIDGIEKYQQGLTTGGDFYQYTFGGLNHIFYTNNGSERMRITSAGNVGIGTTSPGSKLTVIGDIATSTRVAADTINGYTGGSTPLTIQTGGAQNIIFGTNATERMRLDTNGNLGIGASVPIAKLHAGINLSDYSTQTFTNTGAIITSIGVDHTASRTNVLSLMRDGTSGVVYAGLAAFDMSRWSADSVNTRTQLDIRLSNTDTATLTDVLSLRSNGTVGINTTAPTASLDVLGTGNYSVSAGGASTTATALTLTNTNDNASNGVRIAWKQATATYETAYISSVREGANSYSSLILATSPVSWNSAAPIERMRITSAGNIAINTTVANYKFQVNTAISSSQTYGISIQQGTNGANKDAAAFGVAIQNSGESTNAADLIFATATGGSLSERMRITSEGNVGIGNTNPSSFSVDANTLVLGSTSTTLAGMTIANNTAGTGGIYFADGTVGNQAYRGYISYIHSTDELTIGTGGSGRIYVSSTGATSFTSTVTALSFIETSTREKKDNIQSYSTDINKFKQLEPVSYTWKDTGKSDIGLIAEEVDQLFPEFVSKTEDGEVTGINYGKLTTILINIVKQQQERIEKLEQQINK